MSVTRTEAIKNFLTANTHVDLAALYNYDMECQVNVAQDGGERVDGDFKGRKWTGWSDGITTWKPFRIPYKANSEPEYTDVPMNFDLDQHAEAIGMTGWDWKNRVSKWVAFDFDALIGHSDKHTRKLTNEELRQIISIVHNIPWATLRKSTSGKGLHLYVFVDNIPTANHNEHAALARAILGQLSGITGFDFSTKVDVCGGNMWVWARKMKGTDGLSLIKQGTTLCDVPTNWRDHIVVTSGRKRRSLPQVITESNNEDIFEELSAQRPRVPLDDEHKKLIAWLKDTEAQWWWDSDHHLLVTHTYSLKEAHAQLRLRGYFNTNAKGSERGVDHNCFCYPLRLGGWAVRRFTPGVEEDPSWTQDGAGWTRCYLNREPDLGTAARACGGIEDPKGGFVFQEAESAARAASLVGVTIKIEPAVAARPAKLKQHKDGRLIIEIDAVQHDQKDWFDGWFNNKGKAWTRIYNAQLAGPSEPDIGNYDDVVRHLITPSNEDYGWVIKTDGSWVNEPRENIRIALASLGLKTNEITAILGASIFKAWKVVNKPFQPEYPGDRQWNRRAAQLRFLPAENRDTVSYPTWLKILKHCGTGLDEEIKTHPWAKANGILNGADYLKCWIASLVQEPMQPLPYLFFWGNQNCGKSIFHEALSLLFTCGCVRADQALISQGGFNKELESAVVCIVEEMDLQKNRQAYNRIKDWVTSREISIHEKGSTPYHIPNSTHWIHVANEHTSVPIFNGDSRIVMCHVNDLDPFELIPKKTLIPLLEKEAPDFLAEVLSLELPPSNDRLNIPIINTCDKVFVQQSNQTFLERFVEECCLSIDGYKIAMSDFETEFKNWLQVEDFSEVSNWSHVRIGREMPPRFPKGKSRKDNLTYFGNMWWKHKEYKGTKCKKYILHDKWLDPVEG